jgi:hypothetical protein
VRRVTLVTAVVFGLFVFLGISFLLARALTGQAAERSRVVDVLEAQAHGDASAVLRQLPACAREPACARVTRERVAQLQRPGKVQILNFRPSVRVTMTRRAGTARVAWRAGGSLPVVQCVKALREGPLTGGGVELLAISKPIGLDSPCT